MSIGERLEILQDTYSDETEFERLLEKLLDAALSRQRLRMKRYERDLSEFESRYGMKSEVFYSRFEDGAAGDSMDFFEWAGLYELFLTAYEKVRRLESLK